MHPPYTHHTDNYNCSDKDLRRKCIQKSEMHCPVVIHTLVATQPAETRVANTTSNWIFSRAVSVAIALIWAVANTAVFTDEWRAALAFAEAVANTMALSRMFMVASNFALVVHVPCNMMLSLGGNCVAAMFANLLVRMLIIKAKIARAGYIAAIASIVSFLTKATPELTSAVIAAIFYAAI